MIFASDLDRTLIYSSKFIRDGINVVVVEKKNGEPRSYMTKTAKDMLKEISKRIQFVPVTTRTMEQYKQIDLFKGETLPQYAITSNGGNVLIDGVQDIEWRKSIEKKMNKDGYGLNHIYKKMESLFNEKWINDVKIADDLFLYMRINKRQMNTQVIKKWTLILKEMGWKLIVHGRKIYCIHKCVNKRDALSYVVEKVGAEQLVSSGDSQMDLTMESISDQFIVPKHGELVVEDLMDKNHDVTVTEYEGIKAAESVIQLATRELIEMTNGCKID